MRDILPQTGADVQSLSRLPARWDGVLCRLPLSQRGLPLLPGGGELRAPQAAGLRALLQELREVQQGLATLPAEDEVAADLGRLVGVEGGSMVGVQGLYGGMAVARDEVFGTVAANSKSALHRHPPVCRRVSNQTAGFVGWGPAGKGGRLHATPRVAIHGGLFRPRVAGEPACRFQRSPSHAAPREDGAGRRTRCRGPAEPARAGSGAGSRSPLLHSRSRPSRSEPPAHRWSSGRGPGRGASSRSRTAAASARRISLSLPGSRAAGTPPACGGPAPDLRRPASI